MSDDENYFHAEPEVQPARRGKRKAAGVQQEIPPPRLSRKTKQGQDRVLKRAAKKQAEEEAKKIFKVQTRWIALQKWLKVLKDQELLEKPSMDLKMRRNFKIHQTKKKSLSAGSWAHRARAFRRWRSRRKSIEWWHFICGREFCRVCARSGRWIEGR